MFVIIIQMNTYVWEYKDKSIIDIDIDVNIQFTDTRYM